MSGLSIAARFPTEFIVAPTTPTWLRPTSITVAHAAPRVNIVRPVAAAISTAASTGADQRAAAQGCAEPRGDRQVCAGDEVRRGPRAAPPEERPMARRQPVRRHAAQ